MRAGNKSPCFLPALVPPCLRLPELFQPGFKGGAYVVRSVFLGWRPCTATSLCAGQVQQKSTCAGGSVPGTARTKSFGMSLCASHSPYVFTISVTSAGSPSKGSWRAQSNIGRRPSPGSKNGRRYSDISSSDNVRTGRPSASRRAHERQHWFRRLQRFRAGGEATISLYKRKFGGSRSRFRDPGGTDMWVGWGVMALNLRRLAQLS